MSKCAASALYTTGRYADNNPDWHAADSPWKARQISRFLLPNLAQGKTSRICEIGCGAGGVLAGVQRRLTVAGFHSFCTGYDIAPLAINKAIATHGDSGALHFEARDVLEGPNLDYDWCLLVDILEHLEDPVDWLRQLQEKGLRRFVINLPLENYLRNILIGRTDPRSSRVGHLHFWDTHSGLSILERAGLRVANWRYIHECDADMLHHPPLKRVLVYPVRKIPLMLMPRLAVALIGGACLLAYCESRGN